MNVNQESYEYQLLTLNTELTSTCILNGLVSSLLDSTKGIEPKSTDTSIAVSDRMFMGMQDFDFNQFC